MGAGEAERMRDALSRILAEAAMQAGAKGGDAAAWERVRELAVEGLAVDAEPDGLTAPWPGDGVMVSVPGDAVGSDDRKRWQWALERFHVGSHAGNVTCRACGAVVWPEPAGTWRGEHHRECPTAAEPLERWPSE